MRRWSHLERQTGGAGVRGGPGEKQIELDRRMIGDAIKRTRERLEKVKKQRHTQRRQRERRGAFNISLVGYTNAGKSTLFNALVKARAYTADQLFATLDTTTRQLYLRMRGARRGRSVSLSDTVGFIRDLPHGLIDAFQATLQEAADADLLLHVVDAANPQPPGTDRRSAARAARNRRRRTCRRCWCSTRWTPWSPASGRARPATCSSWKASPVPRLFVSGRTPPGVPALRRQLALEVSQRNGERGARRRQPRNCTTLPPDWAQCG